MNRLSFKSSSRMRPLKLSQNPFCMGLPGAIKCHEILLSRVQANMAFEVNSVPLSETIKPGLPRRSIRTVSSRATRRPQNRGVGDRRQAFARHVIDDVQHAEASAVGELVVNK